ncbi:hypothetical protein [Williamsia serinedens]|nr:hypothetical protein [Williamsia serinedens]
MTDTWNDRDLPVLRAAVEIFDKTGSMAQPHELADFCGFDLTTVVRAVRALGREPYFDVVTDYGGGVSIASPPTGHALRVAGQWPSPESQLGRIITALDIAADDDKHPEAERTRFRQVAAVLGGAASQIAIGALGGAGGNMLS